MLIPYPSWKANEIPPDTSDNPAHDHDAPAPGSRPSDVHAAKPIAENSKYPETEDQIVSTFRIRVDECDRLWVIDTGLAGILDNPRQIRKPALVVFDLKTDKVLRRYDLKPTDLKEDSFFANVVSFLFPCDFGKFVWFG